MNDANTHITYPQTLDQINDLVQKCEGILVNMKLFSSDQITQMSNLLKNIKSNYLSQWVSGGQSANNLPQSKIDIEKISASIEKILKVLANAEGASEQSETNHPSS